LENIAFIGEFVRGLSPPCAEKWAFLSRRLIYRVGGENIEKQIVSELLGKSFIRCFKI
jgi:hypothetical protein